MNKRTAKAGSMAGEPIPMCLACRHLSWDDVGGRIADPRSAAAALGRRHWHCTAFPGPDPIPTVIVEGASHAVPIGGEKTDPDGDPILFELDQDGFAAYRTWTEQ